MNKIIKRLKSLPKVALGVAGTTILLAVVAVSIFFHFQTKLEAQPVILGAKTDRATIDGPLADFDVSLLEELDVGEGSLVFEPAIEPELEKGFDFDFNLSLDESAFVAPTLPVEENLAKVLRVIDGDTLELEVGGTKAVVRLIGINAPEKNECLFNEATSLVEKLAIKNVYIFTDESQGEKDKYGRRLVYIKTSSGKDLGNELLRVGLAKEYTYGKDYDLKSHYIVAQNAAQIEEVGIWGKKCIAKEEKVSEIKQDAVKATEGNSKTIAPQKSSEEPEITHNGKANEAECKDSLAPEIAVAIKGNIDTNTKEKLYYIKYKDASFGVDSPNYGSVKISTEGEFWFCSEQDAIDAGWVKKEKSDS